MIAKKTPKQHYKNTIKGEKNLYTCMDISSRELHCPSCFSTDRKIRKEQLNLLWLET
jgi:hypothetical protein